MISLEPYSGGNPTLVGALLDELQMNVYFDDVTDCDTCRFSYQADEVSPMVDFEVTWDVLEEWHAGNSSIQLRELPHDPTRFAYDMMVMK